MRVRRVPDVVVQQDSADAKERPGVFQVNLRPAHRVVAVNQDEVVRSRESRNGVAGVAVEELNITVVVKFPEEEFDVLVREMSITAFPFPDVA